MLGSLLTTKLYFPHVRSVLVHRPRLVERLQLGIQGPLTLISAPAGSGKTTLVSEWRDSTGALVPLAWLSLDVDDNDPDRFLHHLVASLDMLQPGLLAGILPLLQAPESQPPQTILTLLINALSGFPHDFLLVLDDFHVIETESIHASLGFLLEHLPAPMHLVLLTREDPPLPLSRLRARGQLIEIRAEHLGFTLDETAQFLEQVMDLPVTAGQVAAIEKRTEGWVAGLQLAALSMQGREDLDGFISAFTGSNHYIVDYLGEEVLIHQPERLQKFLLKTSILNRLTGALCDAVTGGENGSEILEELEHANLFMVPLDKDRCWYRYHRLFVDLLRNRLSHSAPEIVQQLHQRASGWFEENGYVEEALDHALAAGNFEAASRLLCADSAQVSYICSMSTLERWLQAFPQSFIRSDPRLCIAMAHMLLLAGRSDQIPSWIVSAQQALSARVSGDPQVKADQEYLTLLAETYAFESLLAQDDPDRAVDLAQKAVDLIPANTHHRVFALRSLYRAYMLSENIDKVIEVSYETIALAQQLNYPSMLVTAVYALGIFLRAKGKLHEAEKKFQEILENIKQRDLVRVFYYGHIYTALAEIFYEWNDLEKMESCLHQGLALIQPGGPSTLLVNGLFDLALLHLTRADFSRVNETLALIEHECRDMEPAAIQAGILNTRLNCQAAQGDLSGLAGWVDQVDPHADRKMDLGRFYSLREATRFLLVLGKTDEAREILNRLETFAGGGGHAGLLTSVLVLQALTWKKEKEVTRALGLLEKALMLAQVEGHMRPFLIAGAEMQELLQFAHQRGMVPGFTTLLLSAFASISAPAKTSLLSKREIELLALMASGLTNKEIASRMVISLGTVKRHAINIYTKLDVNDRTAAVARARELGLL